MMLSIILQSLLTITLLSQYDQVSAMWQQLKLISELESDTRNRVECNESGLVSLS